MRNRLSKSELEHYVEKIKFLKIGFEAISDHVIITDENANILYANKGAERATGFSIEEMIGKNPADLWGGNMPKEFYKEMWHKIKDLKQPFVGEVRNRRKDGTERWQNFHIASVLDENGEIKFFIGIEPDIGDRKAREQFREEFISVLGHQLKNPLTAIRWALDLLLQNSLMSKNQRKELEGVYRHSKNLNDLIDDLLTISRTENKLPSVENVDLAAEIKEIVTSTKKQFPHIVLSFHKGSGKFEALANKVLGRQVFVNIITNAVEYSDKDSGEVTVSLRKDGENYVFMCKDNGIGIPKEDQAHIFDRFFRASNATQAKEMGTGLGLCIVKMIADNLGWDVYFESEVGKGATFFVKIPVK